METLNALRTIQNKRSICLVFLADIAVSNSVLDTCPFMILIKLTLSVYLSLNKLGVMFAKFLDQSLDDFVIRFGAFLVYTFIEAARPIGKSSISIVDKQRIFASWLEEVVPLNDMSALFSSMYGLGS